MNWSLPPRDGVYHLLILGAGTYALEVAEIAEECGYKVVGYAVNVQPWTQGELLEGKPIWWLADADGLCRLVHAVAAIVSPKRKGIINQAGDNGFIFETVIHPSAAVAPSAVVEFGSILNRQVAVGYRASILHNCIVNRGATIGHHCRLEPFVTIGPGANLASSVVVGTGTMIGLGANILEGRRIGENAVVGAGALVTHDVEPGCTVMGVPAKVVTR
jgi:sugar O-acyltransferase (sialic acid O-acetyltransferase NeuD family)